MIERLAPAVVVPGHGPVFADATRALAVARKRLAGFMREPLKHAQYAAKVLLKYKLLEWQSISLQDLSHWIHATPYFGILHRTYFGAQTLQQWLDSLIDGLIASKAAQLQHNAAGAPVLLNQ